MEPRSDVAAAVMLACCVEDCGLTVPQRVILQVVVSRESVTLEQLANTMACSKRQVERHLEKMLGAQTEPAARPALLSYEGRRPATFRPNWYELAEWAAARQEPCEGVISVALATKLTRSKDAERVVIATDMSRTAIALARRVGTPAAPPAAAPAAPPVSRPLLAGGNPEPPLPEARPTALSASEATTLATAAAKWLRTDYEINFTKGIRNSLRAAVQRGQTEAEVRYAAAETAMAVPSNRGTYFLTILDRRWGDGVALWAEATPTLVDHETGEILDSTSSEAPDELTVARMLRAAR